MTIRYAAVKSNTFECVHAAFEDETACGIPLTRKWYSNPYIVRKREDLTCHKCQREMKKWGVE